MNRVQHRGNGSMSPVMLRVLVLVLVLGLAGQTVRAGTGLRWAWMKGASTAGQPGTYGTPGTADEANAPGARDGAASWRDSSGALWLLGGHGVDSVGNQGERNDLWKYTPVTGFWTWMKGASTLNQSGTYGTLGTAAETNTPGARSGAVSWTDPSGALWLFGGEGYDGAGSLGSLNDLWKYTPASGWTWMKGASVVNQPGVYGTRGTASPANTPGARWGAISWTDNSGNLWLFGGYGYDGGPGGTVYHYTLNDLWKYDRTAGAWTWMKGSSEIWARGSYGTYGVPAAGNTPGARHGAVSWTDPSGALWLFGGWNDTTYAEDRGNTVEYFNDLWKYDPATGNWAWMKGTPNSYGYDDGTYGTLGIPATANTPGARWNAVSWTDTLGNLWLSGGTYWVWIAYNPPAPTGVYHERNDLWKYDRSTGNWTWMNGASTADAMGTYGTPGTPAEGNAPGARQRAAAWADASGALWLFGGDGLDGAAATGDLNDLWKLTLPPDTAPPTGTIVINGNRSVTNNPNVTLSLTWADAGGPVASMRFSNDGALWTSWEGLAKTRSWTLPAGDGYRTVRVMYRDKAGNNSIAYNDYIRVDTTPPTGSIIINNGASSTTSTKVSLGLTWSDGTGSGVLKMRFSTDGAHWTYWEPPATPKSFTLPSFTPGYYTVRVQFLDAGNNYSPTYNDYIKLVAP